MLLNNLGIYFFVKKSRTAGKKGVLYMRVKVNSKILATTSIKNIRLFIHEFDVNKQTPTTECENGLICKAFMNEAIERINMMHIEYEKKGQLLTRSAIIRAIPGMLQKSVGAADHIPTVLSEFDAYISEQEKNVGASISKSTCDVRRRYKAFFVKILDELGLAEQPIVNYTKKDVEDIQRQLAKYYAPGTVERAIPVFSSIFESAISKNIIQRNPCKEIKRIRAAEDADVISLEPEELKLLTDLQLYGVAERYRDAFVFCCWTGLAVGDYKLLESSKSERMIQHAQSPKNIEPGRIVKAKDGLLLCGRRRKTGTMYRIPLMPEAQRLIGKYGGIENMPFNLAQSGAVLNSLMRLIGVDKEINFHSARKTFANYLLNEKMINPFYAIEMMGWKRIEEAKPYIRVKHTTLHRALFS